MDETLILFRIHQATGDDGVKAQPMAFIEAESDPKYRKKYASVWRAARNARRRVHFLQGDAA
jgi:hypothetical protein